MKKKLLCERVTPAVLRCLVFGWGMLAICTSGEAQLVILRSPEGVGVSRYRFGDGVAGVPDVDGDGWGDVAVGAPQDEPVGEVGVGRVYVFSGRTGELLRTLRPTECSGQSLLGVRVVGIDDADGDGLGDVLASAHVETCPDGAWAAGAAYLFSGGSGETLHHLRSVPDFNVANFGIFLSTVPDVEGPGRAALLVADNEGRLSVFSPRTGEAITRINAADRTGYEILYGAGGVGDINGTGKGDVVIRASLERVPGKPRVAVMDCYDAVSGAFIRRIEPQGNAIAPIADMDADGVDDMILGFDRDSIPGLPERTGTVRLVSGATDEVIRTMTSPHAIGSSRFGAAVRALEDGNADGVPDLLVSAWGESRPHLPRGAGVVYVLSGADGSVIREYFSPRPTEWGHFGSAIDVVPDSNGDGRSEVIVGAVGEQNGIETRQAYLFLSCRADWNWDGRSDSQDFFDFLGAFFSAAPRADFNADGSVNSEDFFDFLSVFFEGCST